MLPFVTLLATINIIMTTITRHQTALKYSAEIQSDGRLSLQLPLPAGARVTVFVIEEPTENWDDLVAAAETSLEFWDNPFDDEDWNDV